MDLGAGDIEALPLAQLDIALGGFEAKVRGDSVALGEISEDLAGPGEHGARDLERPADEAQQREEALLGKVDPAGSAEEAHMYTRSSAYMVGLSNSCTAMIMER